MYRLIELTVTRWKGFAVAGDQQRRLLFWTDSYAHASYLVRKMTWWQRYTVMCEPRVHVSRVMSF
jgi:hypothetical protein